MKKMLALWLAASAFALIGCSSGMKDDGMMKNDGMMKDDMMKKDDEMKKDKMM